ncbi:MAG: lipo-like protein [Bdellovibrionota bacterium]
MNRVLKIGSWCCRFLSKYLLKYLGAECSSCAPPTHSFELLEKTVRPFDVILVEGKQRYSAAIKYLTQSNWSHAAVYIGDGVIIEAEVDSGVIKSPLNKYRGYHTRICRPISITADDQIILLDFLKSQIGYQYDLKNIFDLARYLLPTPPVPISMRRKLLYFGSGDPTKAICSSMVAMAFQKINYPILPTTQVSNNISYLRPRHYSLFTPSDFDRSPYFAVIKPTIENYFNYRELHWESELKQLSQLDYIT